jgi:calcium-dependent protein kinase
MFENSNYNKDPLIKVIDFGLASYFNDSNTMNSRIGTPYYMAPEVIDG